MHMQGGQRGGQNQQNDNRRMGNMPRNSQMPQRQQFGQQQQNRPQRQQSFGSNPNDIEELMKKIREENARRQGGQSFGGGQNRPQPQQNYNQPQNQPQEDEQMNAPVQDAQIIDEPMDRQMNQPVHDAQMPQDQSFDENPPEDVPDDWLMPKVFKSSKNNN